MRGRLHLPESVSPARAALVVAASVLAVAAAIGAVAPPSDRPSTPPPPLSERLGPRTWAFAIPVGWLAAPIPGVHQDDVLDLLGTRSGERATATEVASGLRVMSVDERTIVVELTGDDASAIASARARGLALVPILRSAK